MNCTTLSHTTGRGCKTAIPPMLMALAMLAPTIAFGGVIYDNGAPNHLSSADPNPANNISYFIGSEDFTLASSETVGAVRVWLLGNSGYAGAIAWAIYANTTSNQPGTVLTSGNSGASFTATGFVSDGGLSEYEMDFSITPFVASAATKYWLGIRSAVPNPESFPATIPPFDWEWTSPNGTSISTFYGYGCCGAPVGWFPLNYASSGINRGAEHAFQLLDAAPEPSTYLLFGAGLVALYAWRRGRRPRP